MKNKLIILNLINYVILLFLIFYPYDPSSWFNGLTRIMIFMTFSGALLLFGLFLSTKKVGELDNLISINSVLNAINIFIIPTAYILYSFTP